MSPPKAARPACNGVDQIQFTVPAGVQGCYVPVAVKTGALVSNFTTVSISSDGSVCSDPGGWSTSDLLSGAPKTVANIELARLIGSFSVPGVGTAQDALDLADARFQRYLGQPLGILASIASGAGGVNSDTPSAGCFVFPFATDGYVTDGTFFDNPLPGPNGLPVFHANVQSEAEY